MKLTKENIAEIAVMVFDGKTSAEIAQHFDISVPTVNYHRMKFKKNGQKLQKAKSTKAAQVKTLEEAKETNSIKLNAHPVRELKGKAQDMTLVVNGVSLTISHKAKHVHVHSRHIEITF